MPNWKKIITSGSDAALQSLTVSTTITASNFKTPTGTSSQYLMADGSVSTLTNPVTGTGTTNYIPKFTASGTIGNSLIYDNGTNVGIGTTSPQATLDVSANSTSVIGKFTQLGSWNDTNYALSVSGYTYLGGFRINGDDGIRSLYAKNNRQLGFATETAAITFTTLIDSERMRITSAGNVGIGTTSPSEKLDVNGNIKATSFIKSGGTSTQFLMADGSTNSNTYVKTDGTGATGTWGINITGNAGSVSGLTLNSSSNRINPDNVTQNQIGYNTNVSLFGQTDGGLYSSAYDSGWIHQIYGDFRTGQIAVRGKNNGVWQSWRRVLDETNFSTWAATSAQGTKADSAYGWGNHASAGYATTTYVNTQIANLVASAPAALDTLNELAAALGNDASFATTVTNSIASKLSLSGGTMTGQILFQTSALNNGFRWDVNSDAAGITFKNTGDGDNNSYFNFFTEDNGNEYFKFSHNTWNIGSFDYMDVKNGVVRTNGNIYVNASQSGSRSAGTNELINGNRVWHDGDFSSSNISNWNTAYGWGNHASAGYALASGTANYIPKFTTSGAIGNSLIYDNGTSVGIGTASPSQKLNVASDGYNFRIANGVNASGYNFGRNVTDGLLYFYGDQAGYNGYVFSGIDGERMRITSDGNVGIGTTTPSEKLHIAGNIKIDQPYAIRFANGQEIRDNSAGGLRISSVYSIHNIVGAGSAGVYTINGGNVGIGTTSPTGKVEIRGNQSASKDLLLNLSKYDYGVTYFYQNYSNTFYTAGKSLEIEIDALPMLQLAVNNTATAGKVIFPNGNVGIGTSSPGAKLTVANSGRILGILRAQSTPLTTFYDNTFAIDNDGGGANGFIYTSGTGGTFPMDFYGELILQSSPRTGYNNGISLVTGTTSPSVKLRITEGGNVGIGTTSPVTKLDMTDALRIQSSTFSAPASGTGLELRNVAGVGSILSYDRTNDLYKPLTFDGSDITIKSNGNNRIYLNSSGNVGIGTTSPNEKLTVSGKIYANPGQPVVLSGQGAPYYGTNITLASDIGSTQGANRIWSRHDGTGSGATTFERSTNSQAYNSDPQLLTYTESMRIAGNGNVGIGTTSPTYKLDVRGTIFTSGSFGSRGVEDAYRLKFYDNGGTANDPGIGLDGTAGGGEEMWFNSLGGFQWFLGTNGEKMRINSAGDVCIGTTGAFTIGGTAKLSTYASGPSTFGLSSTDAVYLRRYGTGQYQFQTTGTGGNDGDLSLQTYGGNVGIGTTSPSTKLDVLGTESNGDRTSPYNILTLTAESPSLPYNGFGGGIVFKNRAYTSGIVNSTRIRSQINNNSVNTFGGSLHFEVTPTVGGSLTEAMLINYNGNVGIGTTTPSEKLEVNGNVKASSFIKSGGTSTQFLMADGSVNSNTYSVTTHTHTFASLTSKPTTLAGYGITDSVNSSEYKNFGEIQFGTGADWTTTDFINHLTSIGFFNQPHSIARGSWNYAGNSNIVDAFGGIELAGTIVESFSNATHKTIRITCPTTSTTTSAGRVFIYNNQQNGTYSPGWREEITTNSPSVSNWNAAYGWGNHATQGYLTSATLPAPLTSFSTSAWAGTGGYPGYQFVGGNSRFGFSSSGGIVDIYADGNFYATDSSYRVWHAGDFSSTNISNWNTAYGWGNHASAGYLKSSDLSNYVTTGTTQTITGAKTFNSVINFSNNVGGIQGNIGDNDYWRVIGSNTASNAGYLEIATADDGNEPIYVRQYTGVFSSLTRTAVLLDGAGNTSFPGTITAPIFSGTSAIFSGDINAPRIRLRDDSIEHIGAGDSLNISYVSGNGNRNNTGIYDGQSNIITAFNGTTHEVNFYGDITSRGKAFINLSGNHGLSPSISLAIGDNDTGFNWEGDGSISYYSNSAKRFDLNNVWHSGNDGAGSGLDADLLDGNHASAFQLALTNPVTGTGADNRIAVWSGTTTQDSDSNLTWNGTTFNVGGTLTATVKSFIIDHPTKPNKKLQYGVLEGPEHSVYFRGKLTNNKIITLPDHWHALVHEDTITVNLTPIGKKQDLWVETVSDTTITVGSDNEINCFYTVFAERKDIEKLVTEFDK